MDVVVDKSTKRLDNRGFLVDFLKSADVSEEDSKLGQIYFVTFEKRGAIRGNHYHLDKKEWFVPVKGKLKVYLKDIISNEVKQFTLNGDKHQYQRIRIGPNIAHAFVSLTDEAAMINYSNKPYSPDEPDTYPNLLTE